MHFSKNILEQFVNNSLQNAEIKANIKLHLDECEFCREYCEEYGRFLASAAEIEKEHIPTNVLDPVEHLHEAAIRGSIFDLKILKLDEGEKKYILAADGQDENRPLIENIVTLYSERPEVVLRVMRDNKKHEDYLQLISEEPEFVSHVMVEIPEIEKEFITDALGLIKIDQSQSLDYANIKWRIKLPDAVFALEPLEYDPDHVEYSRETTLTTDRGDRIQVTFEGKTEGKQLNIRVLEIDGCTDYPPVRVNLTCRSINTISLIRPEESVSIGPIDSGDMINIRLYQ